MATLDLAQNNMHKEDAEELSNMFAAVVKLLGSSRREHPEPVSQGTSRNENNGANGVQGVIASPDNGSHSCVRVSCPTLSLKHEQSCMSRNQGRAQAEEHAASLLSRSVDILMTAVDVSHAHAADAPATSPQSYKLEAGSSGFPGILMQNVYESFAILVQSRLRAYSTVIARHNAVLSEKQGDPAFAAFRLEQKLERLFQVAAAVYAEEMILRFEQKETVVGVDIVGIDGASPGSTAGSQLVLQILLDLVLPCPSGGKQVFKIFVECPGEITASCNSTSDHVQAIEIQLDTRKLLSGLVDQAASVVDAIAEIASSSKGPTVDSKLNRSASFLAMPPPSPRSPNAVDVDQYEKISCKNLGLELLSQAASTLPVVSPDMTGRSFDLRPIPTLRLELSSMSIEAKENFDGEDVSQMSADQCADIVDSIFREGIDDSIFYLGPPCSKRARVS